MRTSVDAAGRVVIPKDLRERLGIRRGRALEIRERDGLIQASNPDSARSS
jgi:AbrB family looped-hinge helix DNA binding protein